MDFWEYDLDRVLFTDKIKLNRDQKLKLMKDLINGL
jgi:hypothetical protein